VPLVYFQTLNNRNGLFRIARRFGQEGEVGEAEGADDEQGDDEITQANDFEIFDFCVVAEDRFGGLHGFIPLLKWVTVVLFGDWCCNVTSVGGNARSVPSENLKAANCIKIEFKI
jgi:hypothetical protein